MTDIRKMLEDGRCKPNHGCNVATLCMCAALEDAADEIERLRAVIVRAKDALLDGQSTQWVHDLLATALHRDLEQKS
jgi:hypothetical protein